MIASTGNRIEEVRLKTPDGVTLHGWLKRPETARVGGRFPLVIVFGGVRRETSWMIERADKPEHWGWLFMNYRGFGLSEGEPSEGILLEDTKRIYDYAIARPDVDASKIVVLGRSLGSYFSVALAKARRLRGAILATPFDSFAALGGERYPWLPVRAHPQRPLRRRRDGADDQYSRALRPRGKRRRYAGRKRRGVGARLGWAAARRRCSPARATTASNGATSFGTLLKIFCARSTRARSRLTVT